MKLFRTLTAEVPGKLLAAQVAATSRVAEATPEPDAWIPAPEYPEIWAALASASNSHDVIDHATAAPFLPTQTEGELL